MSSLDPFADRFDAVAHPQFVKHGLSSFDTGVYRVDATGVEIAGVRCRVNRNVEMVGDDTEIPVRVTTLSIHRGDVPVVSYGDRLAVAGSLFRIDGAAINSSGVFDTYVGVPES